FFSSRRRHTRCLSDWSSDVCSSDLVLEEIRLLSGVETTKDKVLRIILAGQPELNDKLDAPELAQLMQRVRLRFHLQTLSETETRSEERRGGNACRVRRERDQLKATP